MGKFSNVVTWLNKVDSDCINHNEEVIYYFRDNNPKVHIPCVSDLAKIERDEAALFAAE